MCVVMGRGMGLRLQSGSHTETALRCLCIIISLPAYLSVCLSAYQSVWLSVTLFHWSTAWQERQRFCEHSAGIWDVWYVQCWETYPSTVYVVARLKAKISWRRTACIKTAIPILCVQLCQRLSTCCPMTLHTSVLFPSSLPLKKPFFQRKSCFLYFNTILAQLQTLFTSLLLSFQSSYNYFICACVYRAIHK